MGGFLTLQDFYKQESTCAFLKVFAMKGQFYCCCFLFVLFPVHHGLSLVWRSCQEQLIMSAWQHSDCFMLYWVKWGPWSQTWLSLPWQIAAFFVCLLLINEFIFNWRIIALQRSVCFCHRPAQVSHNYTIFSPSWAFLSPTPSHSSRSSESARLGCLCCIAGSH